MRATSTRLNYLHQSPKTLFCYIILLIGFGNIWYKCEEDIGPNLQAIHNKFDRPGLLDALVNQSAGIVFGYEAWSITTTDGQSHVGFLIAENKQSITIKDLAGKNKSLALSSILTRKKYEKT